ncbi:hypothetical protein ABK040_012148 [Willaertia magna]
MFRIPNRNNITQGTANNLSEEEEDTCSVFNNDNHLLQSIYFNHMQQNLTLLEEDETAHSHTENSSSNNNPIYYSQLDIPLSTNITGYQLIYKEEKREEEKEQLRQQQRLAKYTEQRRKILLQEQEEELRMKRETKEKILSFFKSGFLIFANSTSTELDIAAGEGGRGHDEEERNLEEEELDHLEEQLIYFYPENVDSNNKINLVGFIQAYLIFTNSFHPLHHHHNENNNSTNLVNDNSSTLENDNNSLEEETKHNLTFEGSSYDYPVSLIQFNNSKMAVIQYYGIIYCLCAPITTPNTILHQNLKLILDTFNFYFGTYNIREVLSRKKNEGKILNYEQSMDTFWNDLMKDINIFNEIKEGPFPSRKTDIAKQQLLTTCSNDNIYEKLKEETIYLLDKKNTNYGNRWNREQSIVFEQLSLLVQIYSCDDNLSYRIFPYAIPYYEIPEKNIFIKAMTMMDQLFECYGSSLYNLDNSLDNNNGKGFLGSALFFENKSVIALNGIDESLLQYILFRVKWIEKSLNNERVTVDNDFDINSPMSAMVYGSNNNLFSNNSSNDNSPMTGNNTPSSGLLKKKNSLNNLSSAVSFNNSPITSPTKRNSSTTNNNNTPMTLHQRFSKSQSERDIFSNNNSPKTPPISNHHKTASFDGLLNNNSPIVVANSTPRQNSLNTPNSSIDNKSIVNVNTTDDNWTIYESTSIQDFREEQQQHYLNNNEYLLDDSQFIINCEKESEFIIFSEEDQLDYVEVYFNSKKHILLIYKYNDLSLVLLWEKTIENINQFKIDINHCILKLRNEMKPIMKQLSRKLDRKSITNLLLFNDNAPHRLQGNMRVKKSTLSDNSTFEYCLSYDHFNHMVTTTNSNSRVFLTNVAKAHASYQTSSTGCSVLFNHNNNNQKVTTTQPITKLFLKNDRDGYLLTKQLFGIMLEM